MLVKMMGLKQLLRYLYDWKWTITGAVLGGFAVVYLLPWAYQVVTHSPVPGFYYVVAYPLFLTGLFLLVVLGIAWHMYKESTDVLMLAVRHKAVMRLVEDKKYEPLIDRLVDGEIRRVLNYYFPPIGGSVRDRARYVVHRVIKYVKEYVQ